MIIPEKGTIYIGKKNYEHLSFKNLNQIIRYTEQTPYLFKGDIFDNMIFYRNNIKSNDVSNILKYFHLEDIKDNNDISRNTISGGEKQRVVLARAIMQLAPIYIFDEPTSNLDSELQYLIMKYLTDLPSTVIIISHITDSKIKNLFNEIIQL